MGKFLSLWRRKEEKRERPIRIDIGECKLPLLKQKQLIGRLVEVVSDKPIVLHLSDYRMGDIISEISKPVSAVDQYFSTSMKTRILARYNVEGADFVVETTFELETGYENEFGEEQEPYKKVFVRLIQNNYDTLSLYSMIGRMIETPEGLLFKMTNADYVERPPTTPRDEWVAHEIAIRKEKQKEKEAR
ncbi:MAG: hypothetical protein J7K68_04265 [Candidatus Diapherotrites archaeon]|nr:hypothetical protein [Candidatus Diapherotrites archaeon]